jgi:hypothetical protein
LDRHNNNGFASSVHPAPQHQLKQQQLKIDKIPDFSIMILSILVIRNPPKPSRNRGSLLKAVERENEFSSFSMAS